MGLKALFDTNILFDYLSGYTKAKSEISLYNKGVISIVSWMEVCVGIENEEDAPAIKSFLQSFEILPVTTVVAEEAVFLRKKYRVKLPDAIIWASAISNGLTLITRSTKDFKESYPGIRVPYKI